MPIPCLGNTTTRLFRIGCTQASQNWADRSLYITTTTLTTGNDSTPLSCYWRINPRNMTIETKKPVIRVAVIGAGASGLVQTQQLLEAWSREAVKTKLEVVVFEAREDVGGVW